MGNTFSRVTEVSEQSKLREMSAMISENEFVIDRAKVFKNSKFIVVAKVEKAGQGDGEQTRGQLTNIMKSYFHNEITEMRKENKQINELTKEELIASIKSLETKLVDQQGIFIS